MRLSKVFLLSLVLLLTCNLLNAQTVEDPDPGRFQEQIEVFMQWDAKNSFPEDGILFVGSSSIRFWKTHQAFPELPVINRGFGGSHISDVQHYYEKVIQKYDPAVIVFYAGDNDVAADKPVQQVVEDYRQLTDRIMQDFPGAKFVYVPIKPSSSRWGYWKTMGEANREIREYNKQHDQLYYVDLATPLLENGKPNDSLFIEDLLHLNEKGYAVWNRIIGPKLKELY
ncbi:GDSL-type esterase/lipase family protein [Aliifodinibius sp. S!AR15-10]|uniref:GDSL-type esterase/lipase family protein n=1 Tax=Aliifodinibius sp. S!AR15-10 TaxID=2950437 RepID=UPI00286634E0|nr:GDSL-type esterase/lipase family protein [Aliifodinibius sp. S!AR15-10]MDR8392436.1 GDSL-type esterase/lipase family protein [Aliifodinibius sp. S!AR15-10]